jgi:Na+-driven multidrug efflux pump
MKEKTASKKEMFETMPVPKAIAAMAVPTVISQLVNLIYNMVDTFYIGMTGDAYKTAAVTLAFTVCPPTTPSSPAAIPCGRRRRPGGRR